MACRTDYMEPTRDEIWRHSCNLEFNLAICCAWIAAQTSGDETVIGRPFYDFYLEHVDRQQKPDGAEFAAGYPFPENYVGMSLLRPWWEGRHHDWKTREYARRFGNEDPAETVNNLTAMLCACLARMTAQGIELPVPELPHPDATNSLADWWARHQEADARRVEHERTEALRRDAAKKLTPDERRALKLPDPE